MDVQIEDAGPCRKKIRIELPGERVDEEYAKNYRELGQSMVVPGFRRGKAPRRLMERKFGKQVDEQVRATLLTETLEKAFEEKEIHPIVDPDIDFEAIACRPGEPLVIAFELEVRPEFDLPDHTQIEVERHPVAVTDEEVDEALSELRHHRAVETPLEEDAVVERGDRLLVDLATCPTEWEGEPSDCPEADRDENLGIGILTEEQEAATEPGTIYYDPPAFLGKKRGDEALGEFAERKHGDHLHPGIRWSARIKEIKRFEIPELDDEFAQELDAENLSALRAKVREQIEASAENREDRAVEERIVNALIERTELDLPDSFVEIGLSDVRNRRRALFQHSDISETDVETIVDQIDDEEKERVIRDLKGSLILDQIAETEGISVTEDEIDIRIAQIAGAQGRWPNEVRGSLEAEGLIDNMRREIRLSKTREFLRAGAQIQDNNRDETSGDDSAGPDNAE